ncbi:MAG: UDP-N-acetylmuramate dehydrogenase [Acetivibrio sp.]
MKKEVDRQRFEKQLFDVVGKNKIKIKESMKIHTTFRIGGSAEYFINPETKEEIAETVKLCKKEKMPFYVMGNGSNLLVGDKGFSGVILQIGKNMDTFQIKEDGKVTADAGILLSKLAQETAKQGLSGFEFASGIPGTLGGAITMNAGAYGGEIKDVIVEATILDDHNQIKTLSKDELLLDYRRSIIQDKDYIVLGAVFQLQPGEPETIYARMNELNEKRREKQPLNYPSAGSTFKRPEGYFAGKLIEDAGLRGFQIGDAAVSQKHCGFVVNMGNATAAQVKELITEVDRVVFEKFKVHLEPEIRMIGNFDRKETMDK